MDEVVADISELFENVEIKNSGFQNHPADKTGKSKTTDIYFDFKSGDAAKVSCFDWSEKMTKKFSYGDHLRVAIANNELSEWLRNEAF